MIDLRLITFITVAKTKNFTRAAEILNISQPAVYQQIQYLEAYYGVKFITKEGRDLNLTEEGKVFTVCKRNGGNVQWNGRKIEKSVIN